MLTTVVSEHINNCVFVIERRRRRTKKVMSCFVLGTQLESTGGFDGAYVVLEAQPPFSFGSSVNEYVYNSSEYQIHQIHIFEHFGCCFCCRNSPVVTPSPEKGNHGYSPHRPEMFGMSNTFTNVMFLHLVHLFQLYV